MESLSLCRICLAADVRLCSIAGHLEDMYETITAMKFKTEDGRPIVACYICHARLQNCYRLRMRCLNSEELLTDIISSGEIKLQDVLSTNTFRVVSALRLSLGHELQDNTECQVKEEPLEVFYDADPPLDPLYSEDSEDITLEIEDTIVQEYKPNGDGSFSQSADSVYLEVNDPKTDIFVLKEHEESDPQLITENENVVLEASNIHKINDKTVCTIYKHEDNKLVAHREVDKQTSKSSRAMACSDEERFICDMCKKCFRQRKYLVQHMRIHIGKKQFQCNVCNKFFRTKSNLTRHMSLHTGEEQFQCNLCNKYFISKQFLSQHIYAHNDEKQFHCGVCRKFFNRKSSLKLHMLTHTGEKQFQCTMCNKCFRQNTHLKQHMCTHTDDKPFKCNVCNKSFKRKNILTQHMRTHIRKKSFLH